MRFEPENRSLATLFTLRADITTKTSGSNNNAFQQLQNCLHDSDAFLLTDNLVLVVP